MPDRTAWVCCGLAALLFVPGTAFGDESVAGPAGKHPLQVAKGGRTDAIVAVAPSAGPWEKRAAADLALYVGRMTGAAPGLATNDEAIAAALAGKAPVFLVGEAALKAGPELRGRLETAAKRNPVLRADAIVLKRAGSRVYLAGSNDESHYYAVAELLRLWGCRWYMPTEFGECIPAHATLGVGDLDEAYGSPFEVRKYWISWNGIKTGMAEFMARNMMNNEQVPSGHTLGKFTRALSPSGSVFNVPITDPATAASVASQIEERYAKGGRITLGMEDGRYQSDYPGDKQLMGLQYDKYFMMPSMTDAFMEFYNNVARILQEKHPASPAKIGFLAYNNIMLPPVRKMKAEKCLVAYLAPIDIDPIHGMDDPNSPPRGEYKDILKGWSTVMDGRVVIYDYDQGMLVWRDLPNPSLASIRQDFRHYRDAGILGVDTESRGAFATIFINLYLRGRLMWNPEADMDAELADFYPRFYGVAAEPMAAYWNAIFQAWEKTIVTEHEYFVAPAIYTPALVASLKASLEKAEALVRPLAAKAEPTPAEKQVLERMRFTRLGFDVLENYMTMVGAAASEGDYRAALAAGQRALAAREELTLMNGMFTTYKKIGERGHSWFPGEVRQYSNLLDKVDGTNGTLMFKTPLMWAFRRDPSDLGVKAGWFSGPVDLTFWNEKGSSFTPETRKDYPTDQWEMLRTDLYIQAQGIRHPDRQSFTGYGWYRTTLDLTPAQAGGNPHLMFPGLFNDCWLYVNGILVEERKLKGPLWWLNDYRFEWDVNLAGKLKPGANTFALRFYNPHHFGGMFRRPFLYEAKAPAVP